MRLSWLAVAAALFISGVAVNPLSARSASAPDSERQDISEAIDEAEQGSIVRLELSYNHVFLDGERKAQEFLFSKVPDAGDLNIPDNLDEKSSILISCKGFNNDGSLDDCGMAARGRLESVGGQLIRDLAVDPATLRAFADRVEQVEVIARIVRPGGPGTDGPCSPPACVLVPLSPRPNEFLSVNWSTIFFQSAEPERFEFSRVPDAASLGIPFRSGHFGVATLECEGFKADGHLDECEVSVDPESVGYEAVGRALADRLAVDPAYARSIDQPVRDILVRVRLENSDVDETRGPCLPPACNAYPHPPPPPGPPQAPELNDELVQWEAAWDATAESSAAHFEAAQQAVAHIEGSTAGAGKWEAAKAAVLRYYASRQLLEAMMPALSALRATAFNSGSQFDKMRLSNEIEERREFFEQADERFIDLTVRLLEGHREPPSLP